jgi:hypothetical protein
MARRLPPWHHSLAECQKVASCEFLLGTVDIEAGHDGAPSRFLLRACLLFSAFLSPLGVNSLLLASALMVPALSVAFRKRRHIESALSFGSTVIDALTFICSPIVVEE